MPVFSNGDVLGDCEILGPLGHGGMGEVYLARDRRLGRKVAVKVLPATFASDAARLGRFEREARSASTLNHPNICTIHALGELADGRRYIVMEHVEGRTLRAFAREPHDLARIVEIGRQLAEGLAAAHEAGVVHRDVKPENVMVRPDGLVKILDFGLAKILPQSAMSDAEPTRTLDTSAAGGVVGTVKYMSPEQARGQTIDARTDIWGVGALLYELVTGRPPFDGQTSSDVVANVLHTEPLPLERFANGSPPELQRIVGKCLRKDAGHRYQTMRDLALDLEALGDTLRAGRENATKESAAPSVAPSPVTPAGSSRSRWWLGAAGVLIALVAAAMVWLNRGGDPTAVSERTDLVLKRLTFDEGLQTDVTFSPDGRFIAYASNRSGNFDIWVQPVDGGDAVQITREPEQDVQPAWSPDGDSIVFRSERSRGGLFVVPALGGHARQLSSFGTHPTWLNRSEVLFFLGNPAASVASIQLFVVGVDDEAPREILRDLTLESGLVWASGHPDGRVSLLLNHRTRGFGLLTVSRDGRSRTASAIPESLPIQRPTIDGFSFRFQWNPSGTGLFLEAEIDGIQNLWLVEVDPASLAWLRMKRLTTGPGRDVAASVSRDGRRLAYTVVSDRTRIYQQNIAPDGRTLVGSASAVTEADAETFTSALSHDGNRLAYLMRRTGSPRYQLRVANLDTGANELLDDDFTTTVALTWSPDDSAVLHQRIRAVSGTSARFEAQLVRHVPGSRETVLLPWNARTFLGAEAGPNPREMLGVLYHMSGAASQIALWTAGDTALQHPRVLFSDAKANLWEAGYVPGGRWISFVREPLGEAHRIDMMTGPAEGGSPTAWKRLLADHPWADKPRWAENGRLLYFLTTGSRDYFNVWALPFDPVQGVATGTALPITRYDSPALFIPTRIGTISLGVRKNRITLPLSSTTGNIWMLENVASAGPPRD
jgi:serine/threonine protein kinase